MLCLLSVYLSLYVFRLEGLRVFWPTSNIPTGGRPWEPSDTAPWKLPTPESWRFRYIIIWWSGGLLLGKHSAAPNPVEAAYEVDYLWGPLHFLPTSTLSGVKQPILAWMVVPAKALMIKSVGAPTGTKVPFQPYRRIRAKKYLTVWAPIRAQLAIKPIYVRYVARNLFINTKNLLENNYFKKWL